MNTIPEIASRLASLSMSFKFVEAYTELYADNAVSIDLIIKMKPFTLHNLIERESSFLQMLKFTISKYLRQFCRSYFSVILSMHFTIKGRK